MNQRIWRLGDRVRTASGRLARIVRRDMESVTLAYEGEAEATGPTLTEEAAQRCLQFAPEPRRSDDRVYGAIPNFTRLEK